MRSLGWSDCVAPLWQSALTGDLNGAPMVGMIEGCNAATVRFDN